jgi:tetratricopeptide (TPR) repeat protein
MSDRVGSHIELEELAQQAEGTLEASRAAQVRVHLASCPRCLAAYEEAVRDRAAWLAAPNAFESPAMWEKAHAEVRERADADRLTIVRSPSPTRTGSRARWAWAAAAAGLASILWLGIAPLSRRSERLALPPAIRSAAAHASSQGLVLPGGEAGANASPIAFRNGAAPDVDPEITSAIERYEHDRDSAALHAACIGLVVNGRLSNARDYIQEGLKHDERDAILQMLAAHVAYRESRLDEAAKRLRNALQLRPRDPVATLDLAIVLSETGGTAEAKRLFEEVAKSHRGKPLGDRAAREISTLPTRGS